MITGMLHSHTQFCDGHAPMESMAEAAYAAGISRYGFSPHSPVNIPSPCNMKMEDVEPYKAEAARLRSLYEGRMEILCGMETDYLGAQWGPHIDYFRDLGLDYMIGSVHFVPTRSGRLVDCDGREERFLRYLHDYFSDDIDYVVHKFFDHVEEMVARGGFDILGHLDKIARNACAARSDIEEEPWWGETVERIIAACAAKGIAIEINTKAYGDAGRFFPAFRWWPMLKKHNAEIIFNSDAHYPERITAGLQPAMDLYRSL